MKQKNLVLMVVAVGCGLLAAFLTSQMSAKPAVQNPQIEVLVVAKELAPGTKFTADSVKDQFKKKMVNPEAIPEKAVITEDLLDGKTLNKTLRADDFLREADLGNYTAILPPEGKHVVTVRLPVDKMTPFLQPNSRVDIIGTLMNNTAKVRSTILIPNMLVMGVDNKVQSPNGPTAGDMAIQLATVAVSQDEAQAIRICEHANVKLSFILRSEANTEKREDKDWTLAKVVNWINEDDAVTKPAEPEKPAESPKTDVATLKMTVPVADLPAGTELTSEVVQAKFKEVPVVGAAPANAVLNIKEHVGRYLLKDVAADQFVPKSYVADKLPAVAVKPSTNDEPSAKAGNPELPKVEVKKLPTFDRTYTTPAGTKVHRYEIQENGELRYLGEVTGDNTVVPAAAPKEDPKKS